MNGRLKKNLGIGLLPLACIFLFNPDIAIVDLLPDVFGYIIIYFALEQYAEISGKIADARELFKKAIYVNAVKLITIFVIFGLVIDSEMPVTLLLFSFIMGIVDLLCIIPGYLKLFGGILYTGERIEEGYILGRRLKKMITIPANATPEQIDRIERANIRRQIKNNRITSRTEKLRGFTMIFIFVKVACAILPEATALVDYRNSDAHVNYYDFVYMFRTLGMIIVAVVGIIWALKMFTYFKGFTRSRPLMDKLEGQYIEEILPDKAYHARKKVFRTVLFASVSVIFSVDLFFDMYNITPDVIMAVIMIAVAVYARKYLKEWKLLSASSAVLAAVSSIAAYKQFDFHNNFNPEKIYRDINDYEAFMQMVNSSVAEGIALVIFSVIIMLILRRVILRTTGIIEDRDTPQEVDIAHSVHRELSRLLILPVVFAIGSAVSNSMHIYSVAYPLSERVGIGCMINYACCIGFAVSVIYALFEIYGNMEYSKFKLE